MVSKQAKRGEASKIVGKTLRRGSLKSDKIIGKIAI